MLCTIAIMEKNKIIEWLNKKGFPFEIECSKKFKSKQFICQHSLHYTDLETEKSREIDICAYKQINIGNFSFNVSFLIECKDSETPWLAIKSTNSIKAEDYSSNIIGTKNTRFLKRAIGKSDLRTFTYNISPDEMVAHHIQQITTKGSKDMAYEGVQQALSCALSLRAKANESHLAFANLYIPVVITSSPIYSLDTDSEMNEENLIEEKFLKLTNVNSFSDTPISIVHLVAGDHLQEYCDLVEAEFHVMGNKMQKEITQISKNNPTNPSTGKYTVI